MHREDNSEFLLYVELDPSNKSQNPIEDDLTKVIDYALSVAKSGAANYSSKGESANFREGSGFRGTHTSPCGQRSDNHDYLLENGMITNSLAPYYVRWYRDNLPTSELKKLNELQEFYKDKDLTIKKKEKNIVKSFGGFNTGRRLK